MRRLVWSSGFIRAAKKITKRNPAAEQDIQAALDNLVADPFALHLDTHKLKGKLSGTWACSAGYDLRIIFEFVADENKGSDKIYLIDIGTHDEVY